MIKKIVIAVVVFLVLSLSAWKLFFQTPSIEDDLKNLNLAMTSYHMEGNMEIGEGEEVRNFYVCVDFKKGEKDNFRISLTDKDINQEQILLRNDKGVYVLTPVLNQVYTFKGDYPLNSNKPYLYHSFMKALEGKYDVSKLQDGYLISYDVKYENEPTWVNQEVKFSKELKPIWTYIYNKEHLIVAKVVFTKVDFSPTYDEHYFDVDENMKLAKENVSSSHVSTSVNYLPFLPVSYSEESTLKEQTKVVEGEKISYILSYEGVKSYTVFQSIIDKANDELYESITLDSEILTTVYGIGFMNGKCLKYIYNDMSYEIYSKDLTTSEMIGVVKTMEMQGVK